MICLNGADVLDDKLEALRTFGYTEVLDWPSCIYAGAFPPPGWPGRAVFTVHPWDPRTGTEGEAIHLLAVNKDSQRMIRSKDYAYLRSLWNIDNAAPAEMERWLRAVYGHMRFCYHVPRSALGSLLTLQELKECGSAELLYPSPDWQYVSVGAFVPSRQDPLLCEEWLKLQRRYVAQWRAKIDKALEELCTPDKHYAAVFVRNYIPDHSPRMDLIWGQP